MQISKIVRGNDFKLQINVVQPQYLDGRTEWEDYNVSQCTDVHTNLYCTKDQIVIPLEWEIKEGTDNVIIAKVLGKWLHVGVYSLEITGIDPDGRAWRYKNKSVFSIVDATTNSEMAGDLMEDPLIINAVTGLFIPNAGPQGHQGEIGPQGFQGSQGFQGEIGHQGPQGHQGEIGPQGFQGEIGIQGFQGTQGVQGEIGPQGFQGEIGTQGFQGPQGFQGEIGPQGEVGPQGPQGEVGPIGPQGPEGIVDDYDKFGSYEESREGAWIIYKNTETEPMPGYSLYKLSQEDSWSQRYIAISDTDDLILDIMAPDYHRFSLYPISSIDTSDILYYNMYPIKIYEQDSYGVFGRNEKGYITYNNKIIYMIIIKNVEVNYDKINSLIIPTEAPIYNIQITDVLNPIKFNAYPQYTFAYQKNTYTKDETNDKIHDLESRLQNEINNIELTPGQQGPQGDKGDTGEIGPQGPQGEVGHQGEKGDKGDTGETGHQGEKGDTGEIGPQGEVGPQGPQGEVGPQGEKGDKGEVGPQGEQGPQGVKGNKGEVGPQGSKGDTGETGPQGLQGPQGVKGNKGDTGETGPQGPQGSFDTSNLSKVAFTGQYYDLQSRPGFARVATSGSYKDLSDKPSLSTVATSGSYDDLSNRPTIPTVPTNVSAFNNDAGYITAIPNTVVTSNTAGLKIEVVSDLPVPKDTNTLYIVL